MSTTKKLIELDNASLKLLEKQAKLQKRSLKNYLEYVLEDKAKYFAETSEEYKKSMDAMLQKQEAGDLKWVSSKELRKHYGK